MPEVHACSIAKHNHACILIWDAHTRMGHNYNIIVSYAYGISHMRMGRPIRVWANIRMHTGQNNNNYTIMVKIVLIPNTLA